MPCRGWNVAQVDIQTGQSRFIKPNHPDGLPLRFNWNAAIAQSPLILAGLFWKPRVKTLFKRLWFHWKIIFTRIHLSTITHQAAVLKKTVGLTYDVTGAETTPYFWHCTLLPDSNVIWVGTDDGNVNLHWMEAARQTFSWKLKGMPAAAWFLNYCLQPTRVKFGWWLIITDRMTISICILYAGLWKIMETYCRWKNK